MSADVSPDALASTDDDALAQLLLTPPHYLLALMASWREQGWLRRLDVAFARFLLDLSPDIPDALLLAAALLVHMEGRGHSCLRLDELLHDPQAVLGWPPEPASALRVALDTLPNDTSTWLDAFRASPLVGADDGTPRLVNACGDPPLMLRGPTLYLRRYWDDERRVAAQVDARSSTVLPVDAAAALIWLDRLFPADATAPASDSDAIDWQKAACAVALRSQLSILTGGPGTGKTYIAARLLALLYAVNPEPEGLRVALAAPTGKAAARLKQSIETSLAELQGRLGDALPLAALTSHIGGARTLHALLGARPNTRAFGFDAAHPLEVDVVIVDEASMIHLEMMAALLEALPSHARVIFLGDKDQLASVEAGAVLGDLCRHAEQGSYRPSTVAYVEAAAGQCIPAAFRSNGTPLAQQTVMLRVSKRFGGAIGELALAANRGDSETATALLRDNGSPAVAWLDSGSPLAAVELALEGRSTSEDAAKGRGAAGEYEGYGRYLAMLRVRPREDDTAAHDDWARAVLRAFERFRVLCAVREGEWGVKALNQMIEQALVAQGRLTKAAEWYEGRPIIVTRNDAGLGVFNGDVGIALKPSGRGRALRGRKPAGARRDGLRNDRAQVSRLGVRAHGAGSATRAESGADA